MQLLKKNKNAICKKKNPRHSKEFKKSTHQRKSQLNSFLLPLLSLHPLFSLFSLFSLFFLLIIFIIFCLKGFNNLFTFVSYLGLVHPFSNKVVIIIIIIIFCSILLQTNPFSQFSQFDQSYPLGILTYRLLSVTFSSQSLLKSINKENLKELFIQFVSNQLFIQMLKMLRDKKETYMVIIKC